MLFTQATIAFIVAAGVSAVPMATNSQPAPTESTCNGGSAANYCYQSGKFTKKQSQDCSANGGDAYCCESGSGLNLLSCTNILNDATITVGKRDLEGRNDAPAPSDNTCNGGSASNYCFQSGKFTKMQDQTCGASGGEAYCCSSGDGINALSCSNIANGLTISVLPTTSRRVVSRNQPAPSSNTCNGGAAQNICYQSGKWTKKQSQTCSATGGTAYCCSSGSGANVLSCSNILNGATIDVGLGRLIGAL